MYTFYLNHIHDLFYSEVRRERRRQFVRLHQTLVRDLNRSDGLMNNIAQQMQAQPPPTQLVFRYDGPPAREQDEEELPPAPLGRKK